MQNLTGGEISFKIYRNLIKTLLLLSVDMQKIMGFVNKIEYQISITIFQIVIAWYKLKSTCMGPSWVFLF